MPSNLAGACSINEVGEEAPVAAGALDELDVPLGELLSSGAGVKALELVLSDELLALLDVEVSVLPPGVVVSVSDLCPQAESATAATRHIIAILPFFIIVFISVLPSCQIEVVTQFGIDVRPFAATRRVAVPQHMACLLAGVYAVELHKCMTNAMAQGKKHCLPIAGIWLAVELAGTLCGRQFERFAMV